MMTRGDDWWRLTPPHHVTNNNRSYQVREAFALFYNLIALNLDLKSVENIRITKIAK